MAGPGEMQTKGKILVVDDEAPVRQLMTVIFRNSGYQLLEATNGDEGLATAQHEQPDLVLLDLMMPGIDGFEVCRRIKANSRTRHAVVVILTASDAVANSARIRAAGADLYFNKPFSAVALLDKVGEALSGKRAQSGGSSERGGAL